MSEENKKKIGVGIDSLRGRTLALATALGVTIGAGAACSKPVPPAPVYGGPPDEERPVAEEPAPATAPDMGGDATSKDGADMGASEEAGADQGAATPTPSPVDVARPAYGIAPIEERPEPAPEKKKEESGE